MKRVLITTVIFFCSVSYGETSFSFTQHFYDDTNDALDALGSTNLQESLDGYYSIFLHKTNVLELLVTNAINTNKNNNCAFISPYYSGDSSPKNTGILSLYLVECILHNRTQPHNAAIICKLNQTEVKNTYIRANDYTTQTNVAAIYKKWWERNKNYSLAEIRKRDINPLAHSHYQWEGYTQHMHLAEFTFTNKTVIPEEYPKERKSILERFLSIFR
jgi:hypothetical protein